VSFSLPFYEYPFRRFRADYSVRPGFPLMRPVYSAVRLGFYNNTLLNGLLGSCPDDAFHLQIKKVSQNAAGIQPSVFDEVVNVARLLGAKYGVNHSFCWS
jgi:hypothetical protein